jgi:flagellar biosynthetic protein FliQ
MLTEGYVYDVLREALRIAVLISAPVLVAALVTGVSIGLFQALTSIQEMTLTFVPKLMAMLGVFWASMNFMTQSLIDFFQTTIVPSIAGG